MQAKPRHHLTIPHIATLAAMWAAKALRVVRQIYRSVLGVTLALALLSFLLYFYQRTKPPARPPRPWYTRRGLPCELSESAIDDLVRLAFSMHDVLTEKRVPHALCYGTLWGALRGGRVLPWDNNVDFCALDEHLSSVSFEELSEAFLEKGILFTYDWTRGVYRAHFYRGVNGYLTLFSRTRSSWGRSDGGDNDVCVPGGWARAVWRWFGQRQLTFPAMLLEAPFREEPFHGRTLPVPNEGIEMLKYLYPDSWWRVVKPPGCD